MNKLEMNEFGLSESMESVLAQLAALVSVAHHTIASTDRSVYLDETVQLLITAKNLVADAEQYRTEWDQLISRKRS
jgi:hypothetical protein